MVGAVVLLSLVSFAIVLSACDGDRSDGVVADQPMTIILALLNLNAHFVRTIKIARSGIAMA